MSVHHNPSGYVGTGYGLSPYLRVQPANPATPSAGAAGPDRAVPPTPPPVAPTQNVTVPWYRNLGAGIRTRDVGILGVRI